MANVTVLKKANANGCPVFSSGPPGIPVTVTEPTSGVQVNCWLRPASSLFAAVNAGGSVVFDEVTLPARRNADEFAGGHIRTTPEQAAATAAAAAQAAEDAGLVTDRANLQAYLDMIRPVNPAARSPEQRAFYALAKIVTGRE